MAKADYTALGPHPPPTSRLTSWRPPWLRRRIFATYIAVYVVIVSLVGGLYGYSSRSNGLASARRSDEWLWRFGPVAILTVLAAFWTRVEFQAMVYQPWINLLKARDQNDNNYYLDYTDMILPAAVFKSAKSGHYLVLLTLLIGIFLKVQIILAPALFRLNAAEMPVKVPLTVHDAFGGPPVILNTFDPRPYYTFHGMSKYNHSLPFGIGSQVSYQTFSPTDDSSMQYEKSQSLIEAEVDALMVDLHCLPLSRCNPKVQLGTTSYSIDYTLTFDGCGGDSGSLKFYTTDLFSTKPKHDSSTWKHVVSSPNSTVDYTCDSITKTNQPFVIANVQRRFRDTDNTTYDVPPADVICHGITCASDTWITKVLVTDHGGANQSVRVVDSGDRRPLDGSKIGSFDDIFSSSFPSLDLQSNITSLPFHLHWLADLGFIPSAESVEWDVFTDGLKRFYNALSPAVGHFQMKSAAPSQVEGRRLVQIDRLFVDGRISVAIGVLSGAAFILATLLLLALAPEPGLFERDPATILGSAAYLSRLPQLQSKLFPKATTTTVPREFPQDPEARGTTSQSNEYRGWGHVSRYPLPLKPAIRLLFVSCLAGVVGVLIALGILSRRSESGIVVVDDGGLRHLYWTVIPAFFMFLISAYVQSCNSQIRSLSIFRGLSFTDTPAVFLDVSLRDIISPRVIYRAVRMSFFNVALSEVLAVSATFLGIFASLLYTADTSPGVKEIRVSQTDVFDSLELTRDNDVLYQNRISLNPFLMTREDDGIIYPRGTYADLVFPSLNVREAAADTPARNTSAVVTVTGLQLEQNCSYVSQSAIKIDVYGDAPDGFINISGNSTCPTVKWSNQRKLPYGKDGRGDILYLAIGANPGDPERVCSEDIRNTRLAMNKSFVWGVFNSSTRSFDNLRMADCVYSFAEVDMELTLTGRNLEDLDTERPPRIVKGTARKPQRDINVPIFEQRGSFFPDMSPKPTLGDTPPEVLRSGDFNVLFKPFGSIPHTMVADPSQAAADQILRALNYNTRLISAQLVNMESRLPVSDIEDDDLPRPVLMSITENDRKILTQNIVPAILIGSILMILAVAHVWGLVSACILSRAGAENRSRGFLDFGMKERVPDNAWSIASMASLLRESNMTAVLPEEAFWLPPAEAEPFLVSMWCRMGWLGGQLGEGGRYFTIVLFGSSRDEEEAKGREAPAVGGGDSSEDEPAPSPPTGEDGTTEDGGGSSGDEDEDDLAPGLGQHDSTDNMDNGQHGTGEDEDDPAHNSWDNTDRTDNTESGQNGTRHI